MGAQLASAHSALNMKLLVVLTLAAIAAAEPEAEAKADPYYYGGYGLGYGLRSYVTDWVVLATATVMDFTTERGKRRLSPRLRLSTTTKVTVSATTDLVTGLVT